MTISQTYETYRPLLFSLAYRMLGSVSDAEDIIQDVFLDYYQLESHSILHEKAYLARMVTNRCLNLQGSALKRREAYVGIWLPEPVVTYDLFTNDDPEKQLMRYENVTYAMLVMLERLNGIERAIVLLRESLAFDYAEIALIVNKSEANCRKIMSRAKDKLGDALTTPSFNSEKASQLAQAFIHGAETGNTAILIDLLAEDAILSSDGGGKVRAAINPILGRDRIIAFFVGLSRKGTLGKGYLTANVSGQSGLLLMQDDKPRKVMTFQWDNSGERIEQIFLIMNPDKLNHVTNGNSILS
ncbi:RNA polymerase sigma-70 factor [Paenibacillus sp. L3-i20]|uniref:RNA polymerase sigma-70 factor n=1 Tax=Paenibacillus sp. L3-i20 TaxID=2905833 RepID=UPI001EE0AC59|nr:RNA polymerase sigma-70 factor [Paenibacillus sp. L3-i20]GKU76968.1 RNA polymerase sigma factor SigJ [Paenibacillus sp. L3-i20]